VLIRLLNEQPLNTEPDSKELASSFITPNDLVFNRNHDSVVRTDAPALDGSVWSLSVAVDQDVKLPDSNVARQPLTLDTIKGKHELVEVVATLECAGNRRAELASSHQKAEGIQWGNAVIANVIWGGASLRSVLLSAGVPDPFGHHSDLTLLEPSSAASLSDAAEWAHPLHLHLFSAQESSESDDPTRKEYFAASIPLPTAMHPNQGCLLAYEYNRQSLTQRHGAPLRAVIPGHVGARWVKWLNGLKISTRENDSPPMRQDYKLLAPSQNPSTEDEAAYAEKASHDPDFRARELRHQKPLQRLEASCSITQPAHDSQTVTATNGSVSIKGYAVGQDGSPATQVWLALLPEPTGDVPSQDLLTSLPAELEWKQAQIPHPDDSGASHRSAAAGRWSWAWTLWQLDMPVPSSQQKWALVARCGKSQRVTSSSAHEDERAVADLPILPPWFSLLQQ